MDYIIHIVKDCLMTSRWSTRLFQMPSLYQTHDKIVFGDMINLMTLMFSQLLRYNSSLGEIHV